MNKKAVFFDLDGVLVDSERVHQKMWRDYSDAIHASIPPERFYCLVGSHRSLELWDQILEGTIMSGREEEFLSGFLEFGPKWSENIRLWEHIFPDVEEFLKFLKKKNVYIACASSSNISYIRNILGGAGLLEYFDLLATSDDFEKSKPAPDIYLYCLEKSGVRAEECMVVEDSFYGIEAGKTAGIMVCARRDTEFYLNQSRADLLFDKLDELKMYFSDNTER